MDWNTRRYYQFEKDMLKSLDQVCTKYDVDMKIENISSKNTYFNMDLKVIKRSLIDRSDTQDYLNIPNYKFEVIILFKDVKELRKIIKKAELKYDYTYYDFPTMSIYCYNKKSSKPFELENYTFVECVEYTPTSKQPSIIEKQKELKLKYDFVYYDIESKTLKCYILKNKEDSINLSLNEILNRKSKYERKVDRINKLLNSTQR